jgi:hypothetical protein
MQDRPRLARWLLLIVCALPLVAAGKIQISGTYQGHAPAHDAAKRVFTLVLAPDGTAVFTTQYAGNSDVVEHGRWTRNGTQVVLALDPMGPNRPPSPITFRHHNRALTPLHWDTSEWGHAGPPVLHRSSSRQGGT